MRQVCAARPPRPLPDSETTGGALARRRFWIAVLLLSLVGALLWPAQRVFRLSSSTPFNAAPPFSLARPAPSGVLIDQIRVTWNQLEATLAPCDRATATIDSTPPRPGRAPTTARQAAIARDACRQAGLNLLAMRPPQAAAVPERVAFDEALRRCQYLYVVEGNSHGRLAEALKRGGREAATFEAWADVQEANVNALGCRVGFIAAGRQAGLPSSFFEPAAPIRPVPATRSARRSRA